MKTFEARIYLFVNQKEYKKITCDSNVDLNFDFYIKRKKHTIILNNYKNISYNKHSFLNELCINITLEVDDNIGENDFYLDLQELSFNYSKEEIFTFFKADLFLYHEDYIDLSKKPDIFHSKNSKNEHSDYIK